MLNHYVPSDINKNFEMTHNYFLFYLYIILILISDYYFWNYFTEIQVYQCYTYSWFSLTSSGLSADAMYGTNFGIEFVSRI